MNWVRRRNLPGGRHHSCRGTLHHGEVSSSGMDCLFGKLFHQGPVKTFRKGKYLHDVMQGQSSFYTSQKVRLRLSDDWECHSYQQGKAFDSMNLHKKQIKKWYFKTIGFLYLSKGLESGCQMMGIVIHLKNTRNLVLIFQRFA